MGYNPELQTAVNKPLGMAQAGPTDARSKFFDETTFAFRHYNNTAEVLAYLDQPRYRDGQFPILVKNGTSVDEYWFRDGTDDTDLKLKQSGVASETTAGAVELATDAETQIEAAVAEDARVPSRLKLFNWWTWVKTRAQAITAEWTFNIVKLNTTANPTPVGGHVWFDNVNYKVRKTANEDIITTISNSTLAGTRERVATASTAGGITATYELEEEIVTDSDIITACTGATYNSGNGYTAGIVPASGKIMLKGQRTKSATHMFLAFDDNLVSRIPLG